MDTTTTKQDYIYFIIHAPYQGYVMIGHSADPERYMDSLDTPYELVLQDKIPSRPGLLKSLRRYLASWRRGVTGGKNWYKVPNMSVLNKLVETVSNRQC